MIALVPTAVPPGAQALAPDDPRWVEARCLLRTRRGRIVAEDPPRKAWAVLSLDLTTGVIVGVPAATMLARVFALGTRETTWLWPDLLDAAPSATVSRFMDVASPVNLFVAPPRPPRRPLSHSADVRWLMSAATTDLSMVPGDARAALEPAFDVAPVAAAFEDDLAVSFCHASHETESLWRLRVYTVPQARRRGHGRAVSAFVIDHYDAQRKRAVVPSLVGDLPSRDLAVALGLALGGRTTMIRGTP